MDRIETGIPNQSGVKSVSSALLLALLAALAINGGCGSSLSTPRVIYLEGSGWFWSANRVENGLEAAGYRGEFEKFSWTTYLGAPADHFLAARSPVPAALLARRIEKIRQANPEGRIHVMGLSAGTAVVVSALEKLDPAINVDNVVLLSSSLSARRPLAEALAHVNGNLYVTCSPHDAFLRTLAVNADGRTGRAAGQDGFVIPRETTAEHRQQYAKVVNLRWIPSYAGYGWSGGHLDGYSTEFIQSVIAPRILGTEPYPLDRPLYQSGDAHKISEESHQPAGDDPLWYDAS